MTGNVADQPLIEPKTRISRRHFLLGSAVTGAGMALYSGEIARHEISVLSRTIRLAKLPDAFHNFRIAQISDIHFDEYTEPAFVHRVLAQVNALQADLVLLTGDFISDTPMPLSYIHGAMQRCAEALRAVACPQRFAIMGNHDTILGVPVVQSILAQAGIPLLVDERVPIERSGKRFWLCGTNDPINTVPNLDLAIPERPDGPVVLMCHGPDYTDTVLAHPRGRLVDFMISGHTHGGQVRLPLIGPLHLPEGGQKYVEGLFRFGRMQLYVNRGIGTVGLPFRLNCPPEITLFTLQSS
jgi:hypothetical protein